MKITGIQALYPRYRHIAPSWRTHLWQIVVRVESDLGVTGFGSGGGGRAAVEVVNGHFRELLEGATVDSIVDIERLWDRMYRESIPYGRKGVAIMALSGVDLALHDLLGKAEQKPVHALIGGTSRTAVHAYATGAETARYADMGFTATKRPHRWTGDPGAFDELGRWAEDARRRIGPNAQLMVDAYMSWDPKTTTEMGARLRDHRFHWFEDVLTPDHLTEQHNLHEAVRPALLAGGEHEFTERGFQEIAATGALDLWQPDITWCGGITAGRRIVELAGQHQIPVVPHRGGEVWGLHLIAATRCEDFAECVIPRADTDRDLVWLDEPAPRDGYVAVPGSPGFGVRLNETML